MPIQPIAPAGWATQFSDTRGRTTTNELAAALKPLHFETLVRWDADDDGDGKGTVSRGMDRSPLVTLMTYLGDRSETIDHYRFEIWEQRPAPDFVIVAAAGAAAGDTTIPLISGDAARLQEGQTLFYAGTNERMRIPWLAANIDTANNQIENVQRGLENANVGQAIPGGAKLQICGVSRPEGSQDGTPKGYKDETDYNYTQEMSESIAITERDKVLKQWSGRDWAMAKKEGQRDFRRHLQNTLLFGVRGLGTDSSDGYQYTMTEGIVHRIRTFRVSVAGVELTWPYLEDQFEALFYYGEPVKHALCGPVARNAISRALVDKSMLRVEMVPMHGKEIRGIEFGYEVAKLHMHWGTLVLHDMRGWQHDENLRGKMLIVDPSKLSPVYRRGGEVQVRPSLQPNGATFEKSTWYCDMGLRSYVEGAHGWVEGFEA